MKLRLKYSLGFMSIIEGYNPKEMCENHEMFHAKLESVLNKCSRRDALIVLGDFNAVSGTERAGYKICFALHSSDIRSDNSFLLPNLAIFGRLRIVGVLVSEINAALLDLVDQCRRGSEGNSPC